MKKIVVIGFVMFLTIFIVHCEKKKMSEERQLNEEGMIVIPEAVAPVVEIPEISWEKSVAVISIGGKTDYNQEAVCRSTTDYMVSQLSKVQNLKVIRFPSVEDIMPAQITVDYLLTGEVTQDKNDLYLTYRFSDAKSGTNLWEKPQQERLYSHYPIEASMAGRVAQTLGLNHQTKTDKSDSIDADEGFRLVREGKMLLMQNQHEATDRAIQRFKQGLSIDSTQTEAWMGLAEAYVQIIQKKWDRNLVWLQLAKQSCLKAMGMDPSLGEAHMILGEIYFGWGDYKHGESEFRSAIHVNPNLDRAWSGLGKIYVYFGLYEPALNVYTKALSLNPSEVEVSLSRALILAGFKKYKTAEQEIKKSIALHPAHTYLYSFLALVHYYQNDLKEAYDEVYLGMESDIYGPFSHGVLAMIYAKKGRLDDALGEIEIEVKPHVGRNGSRAIMVAAVYALLGRRGLAIQWLEKTVSMGYQEYPWLLNDPNLDGLRDDQRFISLLDQVKNLWEEKMDQYSTIIGSEQVGLTES